MNSQDKRRWLEIIGSLPGTPCDDPLHPGVRAVRRDLPDEPGRPEVFLPQREAEQESRPAGELDRGTSQN